MTENESAEFKRIIEPISKEMHATEKEVVDGMDHMEVVVHNRDDDDEGIPHVAISYRIKGETRFTCFDNDSLKGYVEALAKAQTAAHMATVSRIMRGKAPQHAIDMVEEKIPADILKLTRALAKRSAGDELTDEDQHAIDNLPATLIKMLMDMGGEADE